MLKCPALLSAWQALSQEPLQTSRTQFACGTSTVAERNCGHSSSGSRKDREDDTNIWNISDQRKGKNHVKQLKPIISEKAETFQLNDFRTRAQGSEETAHGARQYRSRKRSSKVERAPAAMMNADMDAVEAENQVELEEKTRLINQVLELQHTLEDLSARVDAVKEENLKLKSENQVLGQYIENLMSASSVFQTTDTKSKRK
ncbi:hypothetical protein IHE44_0013359 [Lamprotornis superbus]|uniref:Short coiled-coil protein n=2 Tax=Sturnidae TaxID=9170 RepID=A0A835NEF5_9PASS|nr:hypothetical protein IHE44_0013359 [Lamprotornis superbus]